MVLKIYLIMAINRIQVINFGIWSTAKLYIICNRCASYLVVLAFALTMCVQSVQSEQSEQSVRLIIYLFNGVYYGDDAIMVDKKGAACIC
jgi:hypothetical protein